MRLDAGDDFVRLEEFVNQKSEIMYAVEESWKGYGERTLGQMAYVALAQVEFHFYRPSIRDSARY